MTLPIQQVITLVYTKFPYTLLAFDAEPNLTQPWQMELKRAERFEAIHFDLVLRLTLRDHLALNRIEVEMQARFETNQTTLEPAFKESDFVKVNAPAIAFPYLRAFISNLTSSAGYPPLILPAINFTIADLPQL